MEELGTALIGIIGVIVGGGISSLTTYLVHRSERQKFRRERFWDLKREAYTTIIGALDRARAIYLHMDDRYGDDPMGYDASDDLKRALDQSVEFMHAARSAFHANRLVLSKEFVAAYEAMNSAFSAVYNHPGLAPPETAHDTTMVAVTHVELLEELARNELGTAM